MGGCPWGDAYGFSGLRIQPVDLPEILKESTHIPPESLKQAPGPRRTIIPRTLVSVGRLP
jgi:hypothetical protein